MVIKPFFPQIAWLMSWPNSGTSYTLRVVREITNLTTATNYGHEHLVNDSSILLHPDWVDGPFRANLSQNLPDYFILTKTHCGSRCVHCAPDGYLETSRTFQRACQSGRRHFNSSLNQGSMYSSRLVSKAVHLIRNPMDNVVSRFHLSRRHVRYHHHGTAPPANNVSGFREWCDDMDSRFLIQESHTPWLDSTLLKLWRTVPCHAEFFKYIQWHNLAWTTALNIGIPMLILRYEDYHRDWNATVTKLLQFLSLPVATLESVTRFQLQTYSTYYSPQQKQSIELLLKNVASSPVWDIVRDYFDGNEETRENLISAGSL
jgi:Sulfotransferase domain